MPYGFLIYAVSFDWYRRNIPFLDIPFPWWTPKSLCSKVVGELDLTFMGHIMASTLVGLVAINDAFNFFFLLFPLHCIAFVGKRMSDKTFQKFVSRLLEVSETFHKFEPIVSPVKWLTFLILCFLLWQWILKWVINDSFLCCTPTGLYGLLQLVPEGPTQLLRNNTPIIYLLLCFGSSLPK